MKFLLAVPALALALSTSASAAIVTVSAMPTTPWEELSTQTALAAIDYMPLATTGVTGARFVVPGPTVVPDATAPAFFVNFVSAGPNQGGVPCYQCVSGDSGFNLGLPAPLNYVYSGYYWQYNVAWTNLHFTGTCTVAVVITSGTKVLEGAHSPVPGIGGGVGSFDWGFALAPISFKGPAVLAGKVTCGKVASVAKTKLIFQ